MIKKIHFSILASLLFSSVASFSQTTTLNFTSDAGTAWNDGIAEDGEGGSTNITGLTLQIFNTSNTNGANINQKIEWKPAGITGLSNSSNFTGLTTFVDPYGGGNSPTGWSGISIKSVGNIPFKINSFGWYEWGYNDGALVNVKGYRNGSLVASQSFSSNSNTNSISITLNNFNNIDVDDVRINFNSGNSFPAINNISITSVTVLPVNLSKFEAKQNENDNVLLTWNTLSENNNHHFIINHSIDGINFKNIGNIDAKTTGQINTYYFTDKSPEKGINYYQLQQQDNNGHIEDLGIKFIHFAINSASKTSIFPNPSADIVNVEFQKSLYQEASLVDINGKLIAKKSIQNNDTSISFDIQNLTSGNYFIKLIGLNNISTHKLVKK